MFKSVSPCIVNNYLIILFKNKWGQLLHFCNIPIKGRGSRAVRVGDALCDDQVQDEIQEGRYQFLALSF